MTNLTNISFVGTKEYKPTVTDPGFVPDKNVIFLVFNSGKFTYEDRQTGKTAEGQVAKNKENYKNQYAALCEKANKNAKAQKCELFISNCFTTIEHKNYKEN